MRFAIASEEGLTIADFEIARVVAEWIEVLAIAVIAIAVAAAVVSSLRALTKSGTDGALDAFKRAMARGLLIGLDLLIAADIIKTVTVEPTLENATVLAVLVIIRTFLSWTLVLEVEARWPWQRSPASDDRVAE